MSGHLSELEAPLIKRQVTVSAAAVDDCRSHWVQRLTSGNPVIVLGNDISNEIRRALVFVAARYSDAFVTSLSNTFYRRTSLIEDC